MKWLRRLFCSHLEWDRRVADDGRSGWRCRDCGKPSTAPWGKVKGRRA